MSSGASPVARRFDPAKVNRFLAALPAPDFALLAPHLRAVSLDRGAMLHDAGDEIEHVYFPHSGMVSLVAVLPSSFSMIGFFDTGTGPYSQPVRSLPLNRLV